MFNVFSNIQLFIQRSTFYSTFNYSFSIQHFIQHSNYSFNVQLFSYSTFLSPHFFWSVTKITRFQGVLLFQETSWRLWWLMSKTLMRRLIYQDF